MPAISLDSLNFLPDAVREALRRRVRELCGLALIALAVLLAIALATWSVQDPSLSHATNAPLRNMLGVSGAIVADLLIQLLGIGALALILPIAIWGWRLATHRPMQREGWRVVAWLAGVLSAAALAALLPRSGAWPLPVGLGGVIGDWMMRPFNWIAGGAPTGIALLLIATAVAAAAVAALAVASGFGLHADEDDTTAAARDEDDEGRAWISLGAIVHGFLSLKARLARLLARVPARPERISRAEPRLDDGARAATLQPRLAEEKDEEEEGEEEELEEEEEEEPPPRKAKPAARPARKSGGGYILPPLELLAAAKSGGRAVLSADQLQVNSTALEGVLGDFGVRGEIINARPGPVVTLYELEPAPGIKSSRVIGLADDIARSMSALSARVAVVAGRNAIGIELPNPTREKVLLRELLASADYSDSNAKLPLCLGKTIGGEPVIVDLARMPHLLIAGTTGSGKSVAINTMILSLVYRLRPEQCRLIMVDPKMLELSVYDGIPHLLTPVVTDPKKAVVALKWAVREMEERYKKMSKLGVRN
ncbi:MAG: DNA translocase FtsK 4TM domain-containing protein, partial [Hyphomicrobiales bacterium]|nr:DNA translocase FtsK 4TM domain-containing protein [Hyphomicrobiales bacterium]